MAGRRIETLMSDLDVSLNEFMAEQETGSKWDEVTGEFFCGNQSPILRQAPTLDTRTLSEILQTSPGGHKAASGHLEVKRTKDTAFERRFFVASSSSLFMFPSSAHSESPLAVFQVARNTDLIPTPLLSAPLTFQIMDSNSGKFWILQAPSKTTKSTWMDLIKKMIADALPAEETVDAYDVLDAYGDESDDKIPAPLALPLTPQQMKFAPHVANVLLPPVSPPTAANRGLFAAAPAMPAPIIQLQSTLRNHQMHPSTIPAFSDASPGSSMQKFPRPVSSFQNPNLDIYAPTANAARIGSVQQNYSRPVSVQQNYSESNNRPSLLQQSITPPPFPIAFPNGSNNNRTSILQYSTMSSSDRASSNTPSSTSPVYQPQPLLRQSMMRRESSGSARIPLPPLASNSAALNRISQVSGGGHSSWASSELSPSGHPPIPQVQYNIVGPNGEFSTVFGSGGSILAVPSLSSSTLPTILEMQQLQMQQQQLQQQQDYGDGSFEDEEIRLLRLQLERAKLELIDQIQMNKILLTQNKENDTISSKLSPTSTAEKPPSPVQLTHNNNSNNKKGTESVRSGRSVKSSSEIGGGGLGGWFGRSKSQKRDKEMEVATVVIESGQKKKDTAFIALPTVM
ncbi:hypothetical protein HK100_008156 [Physocladia obscura]|uniref:PH domain-containing protein n=1 Tax=Physocladia obscura TaxID=109957 RepID=A0AAD5SPR0_9FUNG|nr:hypothetical protein HK100_008156 [Physocladia obscura]